MTGFGVASRAISHGGQAQVVMVEIRSVNQRFLEIKIRQPFGVATEQALRQATEARLGRGRVEVAVNLQPSATGTGFDPSRLDGLLEQVRAVHAAAAFAGITVAPCTALDLLRAHNAAAAPEPPTGPPDVLEAVFAEALAALVTMRAREGAALTTVLHGLADELEGHVEKFRRSQDGEAERLQTRLGDKLAALCARVGVSAPGGERLLQEVALLVQRGDIEEELARLASHLVQFRGILKDPAQSGQGKTLDFLSQELFREITTIGSKITSHAGSATVIAAKATVERIREQVQNVE